MHRTGQPISVQVCDNVFLMGWKQRMMEIKGIRKKFFNKFPTIFTWWQTNIMDNQQTNFSVHRPVIKVR